MILERLILRGVFAFPGTIDLPVCDIGPGVIAVTGDNGRGKTGILEVVPAVTYQRLPARENDHPKAYAIARDARLEYWYRTDEGRFRALLGLDAGGEGVDGLLQEIDDAGARIRDLNDGKVSTLKKAIAERFPSYELFVNSSFAAQGRGDEFARTPQTKRKDLFAEFLGLQQLLARAKTASDAAVQCEGTRGRLQVQLAGLEAETAKVVEQQLDLREIRAKDDRLAAEQRKLLVDGDVARLEARLATMQDAVAAYGAATLRVQTLSADLASRRGDLAAHDTQRAAAAATRDDTLTQATTRAAARAREADERTTRADQALAVDRGKATAARDLAIADCDRKIAGNAQIQGMRDAIVAAVAGVPELETALKHTREQLAARRTAQTETATALRSAEQQLAGLIPLEQRHARAVGDAGLVQHVPCGGISPYDACQFLQNAKTAAASLEDLVRQLTPKASLADEVGRHAAEAAAHVTAIAAFETDVRALERDLVEPRRLAGYKTALDASEDRVKELVQAKVDAGVTCDQARADAEERHRQELEHVAALRREAAADQQTAIGVATRRFDEYTAHLDEQRLVLEARVATLAHELADAEADLATVAAGNQEAADVRAGLESARAELERLVAAQAAAESTLQHIARERVALEEKRVLRMDVDRRLRLVDQALVEWTTLAKDLGKGGLTDIEIDAAGPTISATANTLLTYCADSRFSLELVTQVEKKDGDGLRDAFTVRVMDNVKAPGRWRELRQLSGGEKTIVQEALMSAIALYVNERSPHPMRTLWRDETGAALDATNAVQYVAMLRKLRELGNLHQIFFCSHNTEAAALADAQIQVTDGAAAIVLPPFTAAA